MIARRRRSSPRRDGSIGCEGFRRSRIGVFVYKQSIKQTRNQTIKQINKESNKQGIKQTNKELGDDPAVLVGLVFAWLLFLHALIATARTVRTAVVLSVVVTILVKRSIVSCSVQILIHLGNLLCELVTSLQHCTLVLLDEPIYYRQISAL